MTITVEYFGKVETPEGKHEVQRFTLSNKSEMKVKIINYGAAITSILVKDANGNQRDVILGFDDLDGYLGKRCQNPFFGATIGRVANRIRNGLFTIDGMSYQLSVNRGEHHLHGGFEGFDKKIWDYNIEDDKLILSYLSKDGEEGYPGDLRIKVIYELTNQDGLSITYEATTITPTPISLTNHAHFNLEGHEFGLEKLRNHVININADQYTPVDSTIVPTGEVKKVENTVYDLRTPKNLSDLLQQFPPGPNGFDINFCVNNSNSNFVASCVNTKTKIKMDVYSDQPGVQLYTGNFFPDLDKNELPIVGKSNFKYGKHGAFCLETQNYPNAINELEFPNSILRPGEMYRRYTLYKFSLCE